MRYLAHTAHWQFLGLMTGFLAWILIMAATGLDEWRLWFVDDASVVASGVAWVGIWRACFYSHALENCRAIGFSDPFTPPEIAAAQVLLTLLLLTLLLLTLLTTITDSTDSTTTDSTITDYYY